VSRFYRTDDCRVCLDFTHTFNFPHRSTLQVPWKIDEPEGLKTFRIGLFGLDKLGDIEGTTKTMENALDKVLEDSGHAIPRAA